MIKVISEWDFGLEDCYFSSVQKAREWVANNWDNFGFYEDYSLEQAEDDGLVEYIELRFIS